MGDISGLMTTIQEAGLDKRGPELMQKISSGVFTLRDMYEQFQNLMKMGSLSKMMSMIPGLSEDLLPKGVTARAWGPGAWARGAGHADGRQHGTPCPAGSRRPAPSRHSAQDSVRPVPRLQARRRRGRRA